MDEREKEGKRERKIDLDYLFELLTAFFLVVSFNLFFFVAPWRTGLFLGAEGKCYKQTSPDRSGVLQSKEQNATTFSIAER